MDYKKQILEVIEPLKPFQIALFGSRARGNFKKDSDYDIMVFWKSKNFPKSKIETEDEFCEKMYKLSEKLGNVLGASVDLVVMKYRGKWEYSIEEQDITFYECVRTEAIYFKSTGGNELIDMSKKIGLFKT